LISCNDVVEIAGSSHDRCLDVMDGGNARVKVEEEAEAEAGSGKSLF
jgi:hypothetical protein